MQTLRYPSRTLVRRLASTGGLLRVVVAVLAITLVGNSIAYGQTPASPSTTKQSLLDLGISKHVKVKEVDGTTVKGSLTAVNEDGFVLIPKDGGAAVAISYSQVAKVKRDGLSTGTKVAIFVVAGIGIAVGIIAIVFVETFRI